MHTGIVLRAHGRFVAPEGLMLAAQRGTARAFWAASDRELVPSGPADDLSDKRLAATRPFRVLIVEDEAITAMDLESLLVRLGYQVVDVAHSAAAAVLAAGAYRPDLVLMDVHLAHDTDGVAAAVEIRNGFGIPSIFTTADSDTETRERAEAAQPLGYLVKPIRPVSIQRVLAGAAERLGR